MIGGIVAEYNPFHKGHLYLMDKSREKCDKIIVALSPDVCQRGEFSYISKHTRAKIAVEAGADLVFEIPAVAVLSGAENYAKYAIKGLEALGAEILCFGSETGSSSYLQDSLNKLTAAEKNGETQKKIKSGISYALAVGEILGDIKPNDILALEYMKAKKDETKILPIMRSGAFHDGEKANKGIASATYIRKKGLGKSKKYIPSFAYKQMKKERLLNNKLLDEVMLLLLRRLSPSEIALAPAVGEGLENRIYKALREENSIEKAIKSVKTKRYTEARLRRIFMCLFLGITKNDIGALPYIRILAMNKSGQEIVKNAKKTSSIPIVVSLKEAAKISSIAEKEAFVTDNRNFFCKNKKFGEDYRYSLTVK